MGRIGSGVRVSAGFQRNSPLGSVLRQQKADMLKPRDQTGLEAKILASVSDS